MLQTLKIENVALIDKVELDFDEKLNVISGETGAGKSIMLDALSFVFGGRADRSLIRTGSSHMRVEAIFNNLNKSHIQYINEEIGVLVGDELFLSRDLDVNGKNICKINGELVPVASVKKICQRLVDVHGQSEHLAILSNEYQLQIIDLFSKTANQYLLELNSLIEQVKGIDAEIAKLGGSESEKQNLIDLYSYQIREIDEAKIKPNEFEDLTNEKKEMQQYEKINESLNSFYENIYKNSFSPSAIDSISQSLRSLQNIGSVNEHYKQIEDRLNSVLIELEDLSTTVLDDINKNVFDQNKFDEIDSRLDYIKTLYRKYGGSYEKLMEYYDDVATKLNNLINSAERYSELQEKKKDLLEKIDVVQDHLSDIRKKSAKELEQKMQKELQTLGMPAARIEIAFSKIDDRYSYTGYDRVEFMFSANLGFELKPLNKVVSGGEMSRVMLAYKIVVSSVDEIQTIVFDEIDSGLSGKIASVVAEYMARLSRQKQIIAISHLPQICAMADGNIKVEKHSNSVTTNTLATYLEGEPLFTEIARLMGANDVDKGIIVSKDLKEKSNKYKMSLK
ncbi:MAG TPA: DNA repair protein RecN [Candidatus Onthoplasma faecigallinarum]|nr:DNA repair protein RecN [Candidatus Onthoplasma faecigallinarum]